MVTVKPVALESADDLADHRCTLDGIFADRRLGSENQAVGSISQRVIDVVDLGPRGGGHRDHRLEEVGGDIDTTSQAFGTLDHMLLCLRKQFDRDLPRQIATVDQQGVRARCDLIEILQATTRFNLGNNESILANEAAHVLDILTATGKGQREMGQAHFASQRQGSLILVR